jgi:hypothetical protein
VEASLAPGTYRVTSTSVKISPEKIEVIYHFVVRGVGQSISQVISQNEDVAQGWTRVYNALYVKYGVDPGEPDLIAAFVDSVARDEGMDGYVELLEDLTYLYTMYESWVDER